MVRAAALAAIGAIKPLEEGRLANTSFILKAERTKAGRAYYLVYFLLVELLGYRNLGQWEKTA